MMISDDPDEDADNLDDDTLLQSYLGSDTWAPEEQAVTMPDWPAGRSSDVALTVNAETVAWFKLNHADWRSAMELVLRAWVVAHSGKRPEIPLQA